MKKQILFVDDELKVLEGLQRLVSPMRSAWDTAFAKNGLEALAFMSRARVDVIVTDLAMPGMDGPKLLTEVLRRYPQTVRFVHSTQVERDKVYRSIGPAHQFLTKPAELDTLRNAVERALALRDLLGGDSLRRLVSRIGILPTMPTLYFEVVRAIESPEVSLHEIGNIIARDMGMSAKVLQLVNSAFFGLRQSVSSPAQAASLLGLDIIKSLVVWFHVASQFHGVNITGFSLEELQRHSSAVAAYAKEIARAENLSKQEIDEIFMAGLFHDMGELILAGNMSRQFEYIILQAQKNRVAIEEEEQVQLGATHASIGAYLLALWGFSDPVVEACCYHHHPNRHLGKSLGSVAIVYIANQIDQEFTAQQQGKPLPKYHAGYLKELGIEAKLPAWRALCQQVRQRQQ